MAFLYGTQLKIHEQNHTKYFVKPEDSVIVSDKVKDIKEPDLDDKSESVFCCLFCKQTFAKRSILEKHYENHLTYNDLINKVILAWIDWNFTIAGSM